MFHFFIFCSLPLREDVLYTIPVFYISSTPFEPIPALHKTRGIGDTLAILSLLQALGSTRWYGLRRENQSSREGV